MKPADTAWIALGVAVLSYEAFAAGRNHRTDFELLSEAVDRYRSRHPLVVNAAIWYVAGHLSRWWPRPVDPLHVLARWVSR